MSEQAPTASSPSKREASAAGATSPGRRVCRECGVAFPASGARDFCRDVCRRSFHNRKAQRGAQLFDLVMALRFERKRAKEFGAWSLMCRMASAFRQQDTSERAGRRSWDDIADARARNARFLAAVVGKNVAGNYRARRRMQP